MRKLVALILSLLMILSFTNAYALKIGVVTPDADHGFTGDSIASAQAEIDAQKAALGDEVEFKFAKGGEASKQIAAIEDMLTWNPDVIMLWPIEGEQLRSAAQEVVDAGVKLVVYDRLIPDFKGLTAEIMGDNETIGKMMGEYIIKYFKDRLDKGEKLQYLRFIGDSSTVSVQRSGGMEAAFNASPYAAQFEQVHESFQTDWSNAKAQEFMENWLNTTDPAQIKDLDFICTHDDEVVDGVTIALNNFTGEQNIKLITSVGGRKETLGTYDNSKIDLATYFFSPSFIREAVRLAVAAGKGEQYQNQDIKGQLFLIPTIEIDKNTVAAYRASKEYSDRYGSNG
jgi:ribose transport system substrate-binding protein